jgi:hypothetical protein
MGMWRQTSSMHRDTRCGAARVTDLDLFHPWRPHNVELKNQRPAQHHRGLESDRERRIMGTSVDARMLHSRHLNRVNENNAAGALAPDDALHHEIGEEGTRE